MSEAKISRAVQNSLITAQYIQGLPFGPAKKEVLDALKQENPVRFYIVLGLQYDINVYPITGDSITEDAPAHEIGKFFISTLASDFGDGPRLPAVAREEDGYKVACDMLGLEDLMERECIAGKALERTCFPHGVVPSFMSQIIHLVQQTRTYERMTAIELGLKATEENGEMAQAILVESGKMPHKALKETAFGEAADVLLCLVASLAKLYPEMSEEALYNEFITNVAIKQRKYDALISRQRLD